MKLNIVHVDNYIIFVYFVCMHHYMRTNYLLLGTVGWRPSPLYLNKVIIKTPSTTEA